MTILYGIKNCTSVKKASHWLSAHNIAYETHDFKSLGLPASKLDEWLATITWQRLLNTQSTTWRQLPAQAKASMNQAKARILLLDKPILVKRPVLEHNGQYLVGFNETEYLTLFT